jgi:hypothetical protein
MPAVVTIGVVRCSGVHLTGAHIAIWTRGHLELYWVPRQGCYRATASFNRRDLVDERREIVPVADHEHVLRGQGITVISWRRDAQDDTPPTDGEIVLDRRGRPVLERERSGRFGAVSATAWGVARITYPPLTTVPGAPKPRCRRH